MLAWVEPSGVNSTIMSSEQFPIKRETDVAKNVEQYYFDLLSSKDSYGGLLRAVNRLLKEEVDPDKSLDRLRAWYNAGLMPTSAQYKYDNRVQREKLALMPLVALGPVVEVSDRSPGEIQQWYTIASLGIQGVSSETHNLTCLEVLSEHFHCKAGTPCPYRILETCLADDVREPDFGSIDYAVNPLQRANIAVAKMNAGIDSGILLEAEAERWVVSYQKQLSQL